MSLFFRGAFPKVVILSKRVVNDVVAYSSRGEYRVGVDQVRVFWFVRGTFGKRVPFGHSRVRVKVTRVLGRFIRLEVGFVNGVLYSVSRGWSGFVEVEIVFLYRDLASLFFILFYGRREVASGSEVRVLFVYGGFFFRDVALGSNSRVN